MAMAPFTAQFALDLEALWSNADERTTVYETGDLIQGLWQNSRVTGYEPIPPVVPPKATYPGLASLAAQPPSPTMTAAQAATAIENACRTMCSGTVYNLVPPPIATPPPIFLPGGPATPGTLAGTLTGLFEGGAAQTTGAPVAPQIAAAISSFLAAWTIAVTVPPASPVPVPII